MNEEMLNLVIDTVRKWQIQWQDKDKEWIDEQGWKIARRELA